MRTRAVLMIAGAAAMMLVSPAGAQVKGTGKTGITIIRWDDAMNQPVSTKAAGSLQTKPKLGIAGLSPTGGAVTALKLPFQPGATIDPLKPGFPAGDYVLQIETSQTPTGNQDVTSYVTLTMSAAGKCTVHVNPTVDGTAPDWCGGSNPPCVPEIVDKCTYSTFQVAGSLEPLSPGTGAPSASRMILKKKLTNCQTGDLLIGTGGTATKARPNVAGSFDVTAHDCADGAVVGVLGVANATTGY